MATYPSTTSAYDSGSAVAQVSAKKVFVIERTFDLNALLSSAIANADIINFFQLPANTMIMGSAFQVKTPGTKDATTFTLQLRFGTTAIGAALDMTTDEGIAVGGATTYSLPITVGTSAVYCNAVAVVSGGNALSTKNPRVRVQLICCDMD